MAFAAMRQRLGEIGAAVPLRRLRGVGLEARIRIEQRRPETHRPALVERERQRIGGRRRMHRRQAEQIGLDRQRIGVGDVGVGGVRHRRIEPRAVAPHAAMHRVEEILIAVIADAGFLVGRDVGRVQRAERQLEAEAAGILLAARRGVADHAVRRLRQIRAALDEACLGERRRDAGGIAGLDNPPARLSGRRQRPSGRDRGRTRSRSPAATTTIATTLRRMRRVAGLMTFFPAAIRERSIGSRRKATPVAA